MKISVLMPVFNGRTYLRESLDSVLDQLAADDELIVQDGGSTDGTIELLLERQRRFPQISIVSEADAGQSDALARALRRSSGQYVSWLNCDDLVAPGALDAVRERVTNLEADVIFGDYEVIAADGRLHRTLRPSPLSHDRLLRRGCYLFSGATFFRRAILNDVGFNLALHYCMDFELFLHLTEREGVSSSYIPQVLGSFRFHEASKSGLVARKFVREAYKIRIDAVRHASETSHTTLWWRMARTVNPTIRQALAIYLTSVRHTSAYARLRGRTHST